MTLFRALHKLLKLTHRICSVGLALTSQFGDVGVIQALRGIGDYDYFFNAFY